MSLVSEISDLAVAIRTKINLMVPRLIPAGGTTGQVLTKNSATDYDASWAAGGGGGGGLTYRQIMSGVWLGI